ncbi:MAG: DUF4258 domain-containing protein [Nitrospirae bacterium]|nr:MAG: DUF4258 domain-containing protein [Nitrospirota bacterium]
MYSITENDIHHHLRMRMLQRGISLEEINTTLQKGWQAPDAKKGTAGKVYVFPFNKEWFGKSYNEKEVSVYYKYSKGKLIILTVKARYGNNFKQGG